jgi:dihydropteroate synthase
MAPILRCGRVAIDLSRPRVMGILNVTNDSFSDGGRFIERSVALAHAREMLADGADIIDIGGESTRPGALPATEHDELERVAALIETLRPECDARGVVLSADTRKPAVMRAAIAAGAGLINDVAALAAPGAIEAVAGSDAAVCLMHMRGEPATMQRDVVYGDVVREVKAFLLGRVDACRAAGIAANRIVLDPGFGFGKTVDHNIALLHSLAEFAATGYPVLVGLSRKSMIGAMTGREVDERLPGSIAAALAAVARGATILRVHDVRETVDALKVWRSVNGVQGFA